jgi:hypothetical protein
MRDRQEERGYLMEHDTGKPAPELAELPEAADGAEPDRVPEMLDAFGQEEMPDPADTLEADGAHGVPEPVPAAEWRQATGEPRVDDALRRLGELTELPVSDHPAVFERVHARLSDVLDELDSPAAAGAQGRQGS